jgi:hypothetical protein
MSPGTDPRLRARLLLREWPSLLVRGLVVVIACIGAAWLLIVWWHAAGFILGYCLILGAIVVGVRSRLRQSRGTPPRASDTQLQVHKPRR